MTRIIADENLHVRIKSADSTVEICNPDGRVIGVYSPRPTVSDEFPDLTPEEMERRRKGPWLTTEEMLERLKAAKK